MTGVLRPVRYGILIGLLGFILGIGWAFFLVLGHESMHRSLENRASQAASIKDGVKGDEHGAPTGHQHGHGEEGGMEGMAGMAGMGHGAGQNEAEHTGLHDDPLMSLTHTRLARGHVHAMGLGLVTVAVSLALAFTSASQRIKTIVPVLTGIGALIYPLAWIVMGYRTPALGPEAAEQSVVTIAGPGASLVLLGILTAAAFIIKDIFKKD